MNSLSGTCNICDAVVNADAGVEETEILTCPDCKSRLVVSTVSNNHLQLEEAPSVEEDWGQ